MFLSVRFKLSKLKYRKGRGNSSPFFYQIHFREDDE